MSYVAHKKQALAHKAFMSDGYKRGLLMWGRQSGKTFFSTQHAWISAVLEQGRYFIVFKTYKQAHEVVWRQYIPLIPPGAGLQEKRAGLINRVKLRREHPRKAALRRDYYRQPRQDQTKESTIQLLGSDQADSHRGFKGQRHDLRRVRRPGPDNWDCRL
jgi:hypothetical protein